MNYTMAATESILPQPKTAVITDPRSILLISHHKTGKTTLASGLPNALIIDTEEGADFITGNIWNMHDYSRKRGMGNVSALELLRDEIAKQNTEKGDFVYDFIVIDTVTGLESLARKYATFLYKQTNVGRSFTGTDVVAELPQGGGYDWLRKGFGYLFRMFRGLSRHGLVFMGHTKYSSVVKLGKELQARDVDLTGKNKQIIARECDAIGYLYRKENKVIASFITHEQDLTVGARSPHLRNKELVLSEYNEENGSFTFHWDEIYKELSK